MKKNNQYSHKGWHHFQVAIKKISMASKKMWKNNEKRQKILRNKSLQFGEANPFYKKHFRGSILGYQKERKNICRRNNFKVIFFDETEVNEKDFRKKLNKYYGDTKNE